MMLILSRSWLIALLPIILIACFSSVGMALPLTLEVWRTKATQARMLAENDASSAYQAALQLQSTLPNDAIPIDRVQILNLLARIEAYLALTDLSAAHAQQAHMLAQQHADKVGQLEADLNIALSAINQGKLDVMEAAITDSMELISSVDRPDLLSEAMLRASMMYRRQGQFDDSVTMSLQAMEVAQQSNSPIALTYAHQGLALSFDQSAQGLEAEDHYLKMRQQARNAQMLRLEADAILGHGRMAVLNKDKSKSLQNGERLIREAIEIYHRVGAPYSVAFGLFALAENQKYQGRLVKSRATLDEAVPIFEKYPNKIGLWWILNTRSEHSQALGDIDAAMNDAERAYALAQNISLPIYLSDSLKRLAAIAAHRGNHQRAYQLFFEADAKSAQMARKRAGSRILALTKRYQTESKQRQIDALNLSNERQAAELQQHELHWRWLITLAVASVIILFVTIPLLIRLRRSNHMLKQEAAERMRVDEALMISERQFRTLVENSEDHIARYDRNCHRIYANPIMRLDSHASFARLLNKESLEVSGQESDLAYEQVLRKVLITAKPAEYEMTTKLNDGRHAVRLIHLTPEFGVMGEVVSVLAVGRDITEIDVYRKQIHNLAFFDTLTNLPNRALLSDRVLDVLADAARYRYQIGLIMMDLDRFKEINDTLGHSVGDQVLRETAERLQSCVRNGDTVARLGGDEFALLLPKVHASIDLANIACKILTTFNAPFMVDGRELFISGSMGIAIYPDDSADVETLFRYADSAMYHAKQQGRNNFQFYSAELTDKATERMAIENDLRKAQERNELELYYQPQIELATGKIVGAEALVRWNRGKHGMVSPDDFISVAEETGLIIGIGEWVLRTACQSAVAWNTHRATPLYIAVNLSTRQFARNDLVGTVQRILIETNCHPSWIKLEITESLLLEDSQEIATMLDDFSNMGHPISIDDFGTGYSALSYLNRFPVSQIKIDRSFVKDIPHDHHKTELVKVMISIAHVLDMELVAEGVETQEQADSLLVNGCILAQGYLFGKPMPYAAFDAMVTSDDRTIHGVLPAWAIPY